MSTWCILLSGGSGLRMGTQSNKTLISLLGEPALCRALHTLRRHADGIILVIRPQDEDETRTALNDAQLTVDGVAYGGADRQESVRNGLSLLPEDCDIVLVHDGARPLVDDQTIENVLSSVRKYGSGVAATLVTDTIKRVGADDIVRVGSFAPYRPRRAFPVPCFAAHTRKLPSAAPTTRRWWSSWACRCICAPAARAT